MVDFSFEKKVSHPVAGVDEVGCGPWAGPVLAAAVILPLSFLDHPLCQVLNDSKKVSPKNRLLLYDVLIEKSCWAIGEASVEEIDRMNIRQGSLLAMKRAVQSLGVQPQHLLIDGIVGPDLSIPVTLIKKGDSISFSIAAASIIAKVSRDRIMEKLHQEYPDYHWDKNMGYGTAQHQKALKERGVTPHHRTSFKPIKVYTNI
jgi:ribonuclease HII